MRIFYPNEAPGGGNAPGSKKPPTLRLDQLEAIHRLNREMTTGSMSALVGAGMGSGKTVISVEVILHTKPKRALIVGVRDAYNQWAKTFKEQGETRPLLKIDATVLGRDNLKMLLDGEDGLFYAGLEMLRAQDWGEVSETVTYTAESVAMFGGPASEVQVRQAQLMIYKKMKPLDLLISDEAHRHSNQKAAGLKTLETIKTKRKIALSGTFFGNKFENAWSLSTWLWGKAVIGTKGDFEREFCVKIPLMSKDGMKPITTPGGFPLSKITGERVPGEFVQTLPCYVFVATPIGPPPKPEIVKVTLGAEQRRQYDEMEQMSLTYIPTAVSAVREPLVADLTLTQRIRLRTAALGAMTLLPGLDDEDPDKITFSPGCESSTLRAAYDVLHRPDWVGQKVLILTHSLPFANEVARRIGQKYSVALKTGETNPVQWEKDKAEFMEPGGVQYLVAVISAVGTAMDGLQANCSKVLWLSEDENNVNNIQGSNRIWRDGVDLDNYAAVQIIQKDTIAEGILKKNRTHKASTMDSVAGKK